MSASVASSSSPPPAASSEGKNNNPSKRIKDWFKLKRPFRTKPRPVDGACDANATPQDDAAPSTTTNNDAVDAATKTPGTMEGASSGDANDVVYYNFTSAAAAAGQGNGEDDVFSDTSTLKDHVI